ncbi:MAG: hypothetical protein KUG78_21940 [Kangiellaceae bacterium]|nr:hypothetical protein [Kangiellaceae bacterium]
MNTKADNANFQSLTKNEELWNEVLNTSDRNAVLVAGSAMDVLLENILQKFLLERKGVRKIASNFSSRINACYLLGLIEEDEYSDLNTLRAIRNIFAHRLFNCSFEENEIKNLVDKFVLGKQSGISNEEAGVKRHFSIVMIILDGLLGLRFAATEKIKRPQTIVTGRQRKKKEV